MFKHSRLFFLLSITFNLSWTLCWASNSNWTNASLTRPQFIAVLVCLCRNGSNAAAAAAATAARLPYGSRHAAQHAGNDGDEFWRADAPRRHSDAGEPPLVTSAREVIFSAKVVFLSFFFSYQHNSKSCRWILMEMSSMGPG